MKILAVDYGTRRIGVAVSDELEIGARGLVTLRGLSDREAIARIAELIEQEEVGAVVVGVPLGADGQAGQAALRVMQFADFLRAAIRVPLKTLNERLTSFEAEERMKELGLGPEERRRRRDEMAATVILEEFLASRNRST